MNSSFYKTIIGVLGLWSLFLIPSVLVQPLVWSYALAISYFSLSLATLLRILNVGPVFLIMSCSTLLAIGCGVVAGGFIRGLSMGMLHLLVLGLTALYKCVKTPHQAH